MEGEWMDGKPKPAEPTAKAEDTADLGKETGYQWIVGAIGRGIWPKY
jgi:hypothetical protein